MSNNILPNPESRVEQYLANLTDGTTEIPNEPESRIEKYLDYLAKNGGAGVNYGTAPAAAAGMALVAKTIVDGKVTEWEFGDAGGLKIHICTSSEYGQVSREPVISSPDEKTLYLVPAENGSSPDLFVEWAYVNGNWEMFGSASIGNIPDSVNEWLTEHITNPDNPPLDRSLTSSSAAAPADLVGEELTNLKQDLDQKSWNIGTYNRFDLTKIQSGIIFKNGTISPDSDWSYSDYIPITPGETLYAYGYSVAGYCLYDGNRSVVSNSSTPNWSNPYVVPENAYFIRMTFHNAQLGNAYLSTQAEYEEFKDVVGSIESVKDTVANLIDTSLSLPNKAADAKTTGDKLDEIHSIYYTDDYNEDITQEGVVKKDYYYSYNGNEYGPYSDMWEYITYDVTVGEKYFVSAYAGSNCRLWIFKNDSGVVSYSDDSSAVSLKSDTITVPTGATKLIVNARTTSQTEINAIFVAKSLSTTIIKPTAILSNILSGKVLCCAGDSITYGADMDAAGISHSNNIDAFQSDSSGNFTEMSGTFLQTWGYQIAARNGMTFYNAGVSGSTMQGLSEKNGFSLANGRYTKLPDSIDYLLIWFGWNDTAYGTLGTISDTTNESYYGGYNVVLPYLIDKYPYAKIGLIVPFGTDANHREAIRLLGNKWGVAVWDNYQGGTPLYYGKEDSVGVDEDIVTANRAKFQANGAHPNYRGHAQLGGMIEDFLRSI